MGPVDLDASLRTYRARKRLVSVQTSLLLAPLVVIATVWDPVAGLELGLGGLVGVLNMLGTMRANERLLERRSNRAMFALYAQLRIFAVATIPLVVAVRFGQLWTASLFMATFFAPLAMYALEYRRDTQRGI